MRERPGAARLTPSRLILAALLRRPARIGLALVGLAIAATLISALLTLYGGVHRDLGSEFRRFGPNIVVTGGARAALLAPDALARAARAAGDGAALAGMLVEVAPVAAAGGPSRELVVVGADWGDLLRLNPTWQARGTAAGAAWLGVRAARALGVAAGDVVGVRFGGRQVRWRIAGTVASGDAADDHLFAPLADLEGLTGERGLTTIEVRAPGAADAVASALARLRRALPAARVSPVRPIAVAEGRILLRTRRLLIATSALILATLGLGLAAALVSAALERRREFALMRALGAGAGELYALFAAEAALLALAAGLLGYALGGALAAAMGWALFRAALAPGAGTLAVTLLATLLLAAAAALAPWPVVRRAAPATILKGE